jgi:hypothetical protein
MKKLILKKLKDALFLLLDLTAVFLLASCNAVIPQDVPLTFDASLNTAPKYDGFDGALSAQTINEETVLVTWNTTVDTKVLYYNIYDSSFQFDLKKIKTVQATPGATQLTALLTKQTSNQHYKYRVRAVNGKNIEDDNSKDVDAIPYGGITAVSVLDGTTVLFKHFPIDLNQSVKVYCAQKNPSQEGFDTFAPPKTSEEYNLEVSMGTGCTTFCGESLSAISTRVSGFTSGIKYVCRVGLTMDNFTDNNVQTGPSGLQPFIPVGEADHLTFITNPPLSFTADNAEGFKVSVGVMDQSGNNIITAGKTGDDSILDVTLKDDLGTQLAKVKAIAGVAIFDKLTITKAGTRTIIASAYSSAGLVITGTSPAITVNAGAPNVANSTLVIDPAPPGPYEVGDGSDPNKIYNLKVTLVDKFNNAVTSNTTVDFTTTDPQKQPTISPTPIPVVNNDGTVTFKYPFYSRYAGPMTFSIRAIKNEVNYVPQSVVFDPGTPVGVKVTTPPYSGASIGAGNLGTVKVDVVDTFGNIVWNLPSAINVTLNFSQLPAGSAGWLPGVVNTLPAPMPTAVPGYKDVLSGRATFVADPTKSSSLGVDKAGQYKMVASGFGLNGTHEVTFEVLTGGPVKLAFVPKGTTGVLPTTGVSGACLGPIDIQVQDSNGNKRLPSSALSVLLSGDGSTNIKFFKNNLCNNPPAGITTALSLATDTYSSIYIKDTGEASGYITILANDSIYLSTNGASGLTPASRTIAITPKALALNNLPTTVVAGKCTPITLNTVGSVTSNPNAAPTPVPKVTLNGMGTGAIYAAEDTTCSGTPLAANNISLAAGTAALAVNFKDNAVMSLGIPTRNLSLVDNGGLMGTGSGMFTMLASNVGVSPNGTIKVTAGACIGPFTVSLLDAQSPAVSVIAPSATNLKFVGTSASGLFYTSNTCTTAYNNSTNPAKIQTSQSSTSAVYFKNTSIERLNTLQFQDPNNIMVGSQIIDILMTPASISLTGTNTANTNDCKPYTIKLLDAQATPQVVASLLAPVTVTLEAKDSSNPAITNTGGFFYTGTDVSCSGNPISQVTFNIGALGNQTVYFQALYPRVFSIHAVDAAATEAIPDVAGSSLNLTVNAAKAWIGTDNAAVTLNTDNTFNLTLGKNISPTQSRIHGFTGAYGIRFSQNKRYLYIPDYNQHRVTRYDFNAPGNIGQPTYAGWIGSIWKNNSSEYAPIYGSGGVGTKTSLYGASTDFDLACQFSANSTYPNTVVGNFDGFPVNARIGTNYATPGWCVGGQAKAGTTNVGFYGAQNSGGMNYPTSVVDDGTYIYVGQVNGAIISRYKADTGQFAGWVGRVYSNANMVNAPDGVSSGCPTASFGQPSPGWCIGGENVKWSSGGTSSPDYATYARVGDGGIWGVYSMTLATDANGVTYIYVGDYGRIGRFRADNGTWQGWIGWLGSAATGGGSAFDTGVSACSNTSPINTRTPGWCNGGVATQSGATDGHINTPYGIYADANHNDLYLATNGAVYRYNLTTGAFIETTTTGLTNPTNMTFDGTHLYITDENRVVKIDPNNPSFIYWMGKIAATPTSPLDCNKASNMNKLSPTWCIGGAAQPTLEEDGFAQVRGIDYDGNGHIFTAEYGVPRVQKWDITGGSIQYIGSITQPSGGPAKWSNKISSVAQYGGYDDNSFLAPGGAYVHSASNTMYVVDQSAGRIKKIDTITGNVLGWIGGTSTPPTGGDPTATQSQIDNGCMSILGPLSMFFTSNLLSGTAWCKGATLFPINIRTGNYPTISFNNYDGIMLTPHSIAGDGTYLYVTDVAYHRVNKFNMATGQFVGWVGRVNGGNLPTGGACATVNPSVGNPTPGWCTGGMSTNTDQGYTSWDGTFLYPRGITAMGGKIYVVDQGNQRVVSYDAATGVFLGWIGRVNTSSNPSSGCTPGLNAKNTPGITISKTGWCKGGRSQTADWSRNEVGGSFYFDSWSSAITNDGANLYIAQRTYDAYGRIEKYDAANGSYLYSYMLNIDNISPTFNMAITQNTNAAAAPVNGDGYTATNKPYVQGTNGIGGRALPHGVWTDNTYLYVTASHVLGSNAGHIIKIRLSDGFIMGWQGGVRSGSITFTGGDSACTLPSMSAVQTKVANDGYITPGWCYGGLTDPTLTMGGFNESDAGASVFITGDNNFIYVVDRMNNRINKIPK